MSEQKSLAYEMRVVLLLGLAYGFAFYDRMTMTFLTPFVVRDFGLNNAEVGMLQFRPVPDLGARRLPDRLLVGQAGRAQALPARLSADLFGLLDPLRASRPASCRCSAPAS